MPLPENILALQRIEKQLACLAQKPKVVAIKDRFDKFTDADGVEQCQPFVCIVQQKCDGSFFSDDYLKEDNVLIPYTVQGELVTSCDSVTTCDPLENAGSVVDNFADFK